MGEVRGTGCRADVSFRRLRMGQPNLRLQLRPQPSRQLRRQRRCGLPGTVHGRSAHRFPRLRVAFLEGGMSWARSLYSDLISHWKKRNGEAMQHYNPANIDRDALARFGTRYGGPLVAGRVEQMVESLINRMGAGY